MSILHKDHKTEESEIRFKFLSDSVLKAFEKNGHRDFGLRIGDFGFAQSVGVTRLRVTLHWESPIWGLGLSPMRCSINRLSRVNA